jgi:hypothetical protein
MVIFNSYVKLPEGNRTIVGWDTRLLILKFEDERYISRQALDANHLHLAVGSATCECWQKLAETTNDGCIIMLIGVLEY